MTATVTSAQTFDPCDQTVNSNPSLHVEARWRAALLSLRRSHCICFSKLEKKKVHFSVSVHKAGVVPASEAHSRAVRGGIWVGCRAEKMYLWCMMGKEGNKECGSSLVLGMRSTSSKPHPFLSSLYFIPCALLYPRERGLLVLSSTVTTARLRLLQLFTSLKVKFQLLVRC